MADSDMKNDHNYAEMLEMMREQGAKDNPSTIQIGEMLNENSCKMDDLTLNPEDLYIADYLMAGYTRTIKTPYVSGVTVDTTQSDPFGTADGEGNYHDPDTKTTRQSQIVYADGLKKGDKVLVQVLSNKKYAIIVRVVEA